MSVLDVLRIIERERDHKMLSYSAFKISGGLSKIGLVKRIVQHTGLDFGDASNELQTICHKRGLR